MADWFKFYENDLDETRLKYAIHKLPEVTSVWLGILSECCRHKNGTIKWSDKEFELFGFSQRLNISIPKVNEAVNLLAEIEYISRGQGTIKVLKWAEKQSEYCQVKSKKPQMTSDTLGTLSGHSRDSVVLEERRVEEKRREENKPPLSPNMFELGKSCLSKLFGRDERSRWSYMEESALSEVSRRQDFKAELEALVEFKSKPDSFFPQSISSLLSKWTETLDRATNYESNQKARMAQQRFNRNVGTANEGAENDYAKLGRMGGI